MLSNSDSSSSEEEDDHMLAFHDRRKKGPYPSYPYYESINLELVRSDTTFRFKFLSTECLLIAAVLQSNVDFLKEFTNCPHWYNSSHPIDGNCLLQIAIAFQKKEVCDYFLSLPNFFLEQKNKGHLTPLSLALRGLGDFYDTVSYELMKKGASLDAVTLEEDDTLLHHALDKSLVKVAKHLMEIGYDVNEMSNGTLPPLWWCLEASSADDVEIELVTALLCYGADPTIGTVSEYNTFEYAVKFCSYPVEEALFYYTFDQYTSVDIHFEVLLKLANERSPFFHETVKQTKNVILGKSSVMYYHLLFLIGVEYLDVLIQKCGDVIVQVLAQVTPVDYKMCSFCERMSLQNINLLLESDLRDDIINFIVIFGETFYFYFLIGFGSEQSVMVENLCYLLSYGLRLTESHLKAFYKRYRYGDLLKIMLHMDIEKKLNRRYINDALLILLYDVNMTLETYLHESYPYRRFNMHELFPLFSHPRLRLSMSYYEVLECDIYLPIDQSKVPLLVELARNLFRKYFIQKFNIKSAKQFYTLINSLPIGPGYKKIITYETKLY